MDRNFIPGDVVLINESYGSKIKGTIFRNSLVEHPHAKYKYVPHPNYFDILTCTFPDRNEMVKTCHVNKLSFIEHCEPVELAELLTHKSEYVRNWIKEKLRSAESARKSRRNYREVEFRPDPHVLIIGGDKPPEKPTECGFWRAVCTENDYRDRTFYFKVEKGGIKDELGFPVLMCTEVDIKGEIISQDRYDVKKIKDFFGPQEGYTRRIKWKHLGLLDSYSNMVYGETLEDLEWLSPLESSFEMDPFSTFDKRARLL